MTTTWGYTQQNGPHTWAVHYPDAAGDAQSPVDISTCDVIYDIDLRKTPLVTSYNKEDSFNVENTGETFKVNIKKKSELKGGPLKNTYRLEQFHLHWGSCDEHGSEHTIDGQTYAAELHLVHWNCSKYASFAEAVDKHDGLAVLGIMIQIGLEHSGFQELVETLRNIKTGGQNCQVLKSFDPSLLLPGNKADYWTYHGSLTTPPCYESVQWIVLRQPVQYSQRQLLALRGLLHHKGQGCIQDNFRPPLPLGTRKIRASFYGTKM